MKGLERKIEDLIAVVVGSDARGITASRIVVESVRSIPDLVSREVKATLSKGHGTQYLAGGKSSKKEKNSLDFEPEVGKGPLRKSRTDLRGEIGRLRCQVEELGQIIKPFSSAPFVNSASGISTDMNTNASAARVSRISVSTQTIPPEDGLPGESSQQGLEKEADTAVSTLDALQASIADISASLDVVNDKARESARASLVAELNELRERWVDCALRYVDNEEKEVFREEFVQLLNEDIWCVLGSSDAKSVSARAMVKAEQTHDSATLTSKAMEVLLERFLKMESVVGLMAQESLKKAAFIAQLDNELAKISELLHSRTSDVSNAVDELNRLQLPAALSKVRGVLEEHLSSPTNETVCGVASSLVETKGESMILSGKDLDVISECISKAMSRSTGPIGKFIRYLSSGFTSGYSVVWGAHNLTVSVLNSQGIASLATNPTGVVAVIGGAAWLANTLVTMYSKKMSKYMSRSELHGGLGLVPRASQEQWIATEGKSTVDSASGGYRLSFLGFNVGVTRTESSSRSLVHRSQVLTELQPYVDPISAIVSLGDTLDDVWNPKATFDPDRNLTYIDNTEFVQEKVGTKVVLETYQTGRGEAAERAVATDVPRTVVRDFNLRDFIFGAPYTVGQDVRERKVRE